MASSWVIREADHCLSGAPSLDLRDHPPLRWRAGCEVGSRNSPASRGRRNGATG